MVVGVSGSSVSSRSRPLWRVWLGPYTGSVEERGDAVLMTAFSSPLAPPRFERSSLRNVAKPVVPTGFLLFIPAPVGDDARTQAALRSVGFTRGQRAEPAASTVLLPEVL